MAIIKDWKSELPSENFSKATLKEYAEFLAQLVLKRSGKGLILTGPENVNINGNQGLQYEVWVESDKVKIVYLIQIYTNTGNNNCRYEKNRQTLRNLCVKQFFSI
ncbi:hypothetical protein [Paenibacillus sp. BJ-4]|uniref:hypothetical protein n=1 Tax=Paenibacillus sp. BJ-4 TaxID=2878097 RepID=UPI001CF0897F|nr:hypothetical protein [Paenibacillus sp. BJ-4]